jgi:uncharacterized protein YndB with AHSA1/START domain
MIVLIHTRCERDPNEPAASTGRTGGMATYRFVDTWHVPAAAEDVYDLLSRPRDYPRWWGDAFLEGEGDAGPASPGKRARLVTRGRLPYRLRWELVCVEATAPHRLVSRVHGDFEGAGTWTIEDEGGGTRATLVWEVDVRKPLVRRTTVLLRPLFAWNHGWAMRRGRARITGLLAEQGAAGAAGASAPEGVEAGPQPLAPVR